MTGGVAGNLCLQDFQPVFNELQQEVIESAGIACEWDIPDPPPGEIFDPDKVNVIYVPTPGTEIVIGKVDSAADCGGVTDGWYYDDDVNPTQVLVCPQTCEKIQGQPGAEINIQFGCTTVPAG